MDTEERKRLLSEYCKSRDMDLRNALISEYLYLADSIARKYAGRGIEFEDLRQIASVALIGALERFDDTKGIRFETYAVPTLSGVVKNYFRDFSRMIRLPRGVGENLQRIALANETLYQRLGRMPTTAEIAELTNLTQENVLEATEAAQSISVSSLDAEVGEDDTPFLELLSGETEDYDRVELRQMLRQVIDTFSETEKKLLSLRYTEELSQRDTAKRMGVSQMYVSRVERKMLTRFREAFQNL